jgi:hypothetical protein
MEKYKMKDAFGNAEAHGIINNDILINQISLLFV